LLAFQGIASSLEPLPGHFVPTAVVRRQLELKLSSFLRSFFTFQLIWRLVMHFSEFWLQKGHPTGYREH
jgi:hypothetical protein